MTIVQTVILGIIEGITEFLPISSTGHLILISKILGITDSDFLKSFEIIIQFGAILAVVVLYWRKLVPPLKDFSSFTNSIELVNKVNLWKRIITAFIPTAIVGFLGYKVLKTFLLSSDIIVVWSLALGGVVLIAFELWNKSKSLGVAQNNAGSISYKKSFLIGLAQSLAIIPGVSRSGATIVGGMAMGISREAIVEFSFLLAVPTMAMASGYDFLKSGASFTGNEFALLALGFVISFLVAMLAIKWFLKYVINHSFIYFGIYRIAVAFLFWLFVIQLHW